MKAAFVQEYRVETQDIQAVNVLEQQIVKAEDTAVDKLLWEQAAKIKELEKKGMTQRQIAAQWVNGRTGKPYSHVHVNYVLKAFGKYTYQPRPAFRTEYNRVANQEDAPHSTLSQSNEWYTPQKYIQAARAVLGEIDLDPASCAKANKTVQAKKYFDIGDNGLDKEWTGRVWLNPPWGRLTGAFIKKLVEDFEDKRITAAIALVNAHATDTDWFQALWDYTLCFTDHRIDYDSNNDKESGSTHGSAFIYLGPEPRDFAAQFKQFGAIMRRWS